MNIQNFIDELITEWAYRTDSGIPDLKNQNHLSILSDILTEWGMGEIEGELFRNILKEEDEKQFKNPLLNKVIKYKTVNGDDVEGKIGNLLRRPKEEDAHIQALKALGGKDSDEYKQAMDDLGSEGQPNRDIDKEREAGKDDKEGGGEQPEQPQTGTALNPNTKGGMEYVAGLPVNDPAHQSPTVYPVEGGVQMTSRVKEDTMHTIEEDSTVIDSGGNVEEI
jgi:hypothetical protein